MGLFAAGQVVALPFPFSDLSRDKPRPVLLLADARRADWIVCQITSNPYADPHAIMLTPNDFAIGSLPHSSYLRPGKLFTANESVIGSTLGSLHPALLQHIRDTVVHVIRGTINN